MVRKEDGNQDMKPSDSPEVLNESEKEDTADGNKHNFRGRLEMEENIGEGVVKEITELLKAKKVIVYGKDLPDNQYSEILWSQYGLIKEFLDALHRGKSSLPFLDTSQLCCGVVH